MIRQGEKVHVVERRRFESDVRRHFVGTVQEVSENLVRATGFAFVYDTAAGSFVRRPEVRTRIISLCDADNVINVLPDALDPGRVKYILDSDRRMVLTDEQEVHLDINEFGPFR